MRHLCLFLLPALLLAVEPKEAPPKVPAPALARVKRVFVEQLGGGQTSDQMRDMIIAAIQKAGLFRITENQESADVILRGSADDKIYTENHNTSDSLGLHASAGSGSSSSNTTSGGTASRSSLGAGVTNNETSHIEERHHEASASIRLVDMDGEVIWSSTQESAGGRFRGAMADVADKLVRELTTDVRKARATTGPERAPE